MKIVFTHSYFLHFDAKQLEMSKPYPPLGTITAAAFLREKGFEINLFDTFFSKDAAEIKGALDQYKPAVLVIYDDGFNYLTKMCLTKMRDAAFKMTEIAKKAGCHVVIASSDSTDHYEDYLAHGADEIILGEAELTLLELLENLRDNKDITQVQGIAYENGSGVQKNPRRAILTELDQLPLPAWDLIDIEPYRKAWAQHGCFSVNLATTRGCPYKCNWCAKPIYGNRYNSRSPQHVVDEIKLMKSLFKFDHIWFGDDIFGLKPSWVQAFNAVLKEEGIKVPYKIQSRADLLLKDDTILNLYESGCDEVWIGAESGSQKILDAMDKGTTVEQIKEATLLMKKHGLKPCFFLQFGYLDEKWEDIKLTLGLLFDMMPHDIGVSVSYPLPGTKFFDIVKSQLNDKQNWEDSDELLLMYKSSYSPKFYKRLHRFIHKRFRQKQLAEKLRKGHLSHLPRWAYFKMSSTLIYGELLFLKRNSTEAVS